MLRQLFKPITLSLSVDGIAVRGIGLLPKILSKVTVKISSVEQMLSIFREVMQDELLLNNRKNIRLVLSNHFVRYTVLPWQPQITKREDWLAIALHDFHKRYGMVAEGWKICVSLNGFGNNVVASAIDDNLFEGLTNIAKEYNCNLEAIEPFLMAVFKSYKINHDIEWLLIAEPERVLLCEMADNQWQRFSVISPPQGHEVVQALQLTRRCLNSVEHEKLPNNILNCSAPILTLAANSWLDEEIIFKQLPKAFELNSLSTAMWMATF